jgi:hypothetical protein
MPGNTDELSNVIDGRDNLYREGDIRNILLTTSMISNCIYVVLILTSSNSLEKSTKNSKTNTWIHFVLCLN